MKIAVQLLSLGGRRKTSKVRRIFTIFGNSGLSYETKCAFLVKIFETDRGLALRLIPDDHLWHSLLCGMSIDNFGIKLSTSNLVDMTSYDLMLLYELVVCNSRLIGRSRVRPLALTLDGQLLRFISNFIDVIQELPVLCVLSYFVNQYLYQRNDGTSHGPMLAALYSELCYFESSARIKALGAREDFTEEAFCRHLRTALTQLLDSYYETDVLANVPLHHVSPLYRILMLIRGSQPRFTFH